MVQRNPAVVDSSPSGRAFSAFDFAYRENGAVHEAVENFGNGRRLFADVQDGRCDLYADSAFTERVDERLDFRRTIARRRKAFDALISVPPFAVHDFLRDKENGLFGVVSWTNRSFDLREFPRSTHDHSAVRVVPNAGIPLNGRDGVSGNALADSRMVNGGAAWKIVNQNIAGTKSRRYPQTFLFRGVH